MTRWTLEQLQAEVERALSLDYVPPASGRVRAVPDARTIRYYTTLGLLDRPEVSGRTALYGRRHLLQLVAIKRLQATGLSLAEVQARLQGATPSALEQVARLPRASDAVAASAPPPSAVAAPSARHEAFWEAVPAAALVTDGPTRQAEPRSPEAGDGLLQGLALTDAVTLLVRAERALTPDDLLALRQAAGPLLDALTARGLVASLSERSSS